MNMTTYTIESVHGIKQTIVLVPTGQSMVNSDTTPRQPSADQQRDDQDRLRSSK